MISWGKSATLALTAVTLAGCDITALDNYDAPGSTLTGRVVYNDQSIQVRSSEVELELWQDPEEYPLNTKIPLNVAQDGTFSAVLFDGEYKLNVLPGSGPWVPPNPPDTITFVLNGSADIDVPVTPYYLIQDEQITYSQATNAPYGTVTGTFRVNKVTTTSAVEYVGLYIGLTSFVDRTNRESAISTGQSERSGTAVATQLNASPSLSDPISITVNLPSNIYQTNSPAIREVVYARIGVKTEGRSHMAFSPVYEIPIGSP